MSAVISPLQTLVGDNCVTVVATLQFDYAQLDHEVAAEAREAAVRIRTRLKTAYLDTGHDLIRIKERLGHGQFGPWLKAEFDMTERSAENYMNAARWLEGKSEKISDLPAAAIYALASPNTPPDIVNEVVAAVENGTKLRVHDIKTKIRTTVTERRAAERKAQIEAAKTEEQKQKEKKARESRAQREARKKREEEARRERERQEEQERRDRLTPIAQRLAQALGPELPKLRNAMDAWADARTLRRLLQEIAA
jgi:flagellar biosynthesis GTPase FlhF